MPIDHPTFPYEPDFSKDPTRGTIDQRDAIEVAPTAKRLIWPWAQGERVSGYQFTRTTRTQWRNLKEFIQNRGGRFDPFFMPTWERDIEPLETVASGGRDIEIVKTAAGYEADYLTDDRLETVGRTLFFWMPGQTVHFSRVQRVKVSTTAGQEVLELEAYLPFEFIPAQGVAGFAELSRFLDDSFRWVHSSTDHATVEISFRTVRLRIDKERSDTVAAVDTIQSTEPPVSFANTIADAVGDYSPQIHQQAAYAEGPAVHKTTQDGMFRSNWTAWVGADGVYLKKLSTEAEIGDIWPPNTGASGEIKSGLFATQPDTRHISLAFDQDAYEAIAWQFSATQFKIEKFASTVATTYGAFDGYSPVLYYNGVSIPTISPGTDCDIICFYLKPRFNKIFARSQRDDFATEYEYVGLPTKPLRLMRAYRGDRYHYITGVDDGLRLFTITSDQYPPEPVVVTDGHADAAGAGLSIESGESSFQDYAEAGYSNPTSQNAGIAIQSGLYFEVVPATNQLAVAEAAAAGMVVGSGSYDPINVETGTQQSRNQTGLAINSASFYFLVAKHAPVGGEAADSGLAIGSGIYFLVAKISESTADPIGASLMPTSGSSYDAA